MTLQGEQLTLIPGHTLTTRAGTATITRLEPAGTQQIIWADYGSGIEQPHIVEALLSPEQHDQPSALASRRHSAKGQAVGWIEERLGNLKRKHPSTSYYYCYQEGDRRNKHYVPVRHMADVRAMVNHRCSVDDILSFLSKDPNTKDHHTFTPKI